MENLECGVLGPISVSMSGFTPHTELAVGGIFTKDCRAHGRDEARVEVGGLRHGLDVAEGFRLELVLRSVLAVVAEAGKRIHGFSKNGPMLGFWGFRGFRGGDLFLDAIPAVISQRVQSSFGIGGRAWRRPP